MKRAFDPFSNDLPPVIEFCIDHLLRDGCKLLCGSLLTLLALHVEGIFRVSAAMSEVSALREKIENGGVAPTVVAT